MRTLFEFLHNCHLTIRSFFDFGKLLIVLCWIGIFGLVQDSRVSYVVFHYCFGKVGI